VKVDGFVWFGEVPYMRFDVVEAAQRIKVGELAAVRVAAVQSVTVQSVTVQSVTVMYDRASWALVAAQYRNS
jgi:hypothetical protein